MNENVQDTSADILVRSVACTLPWQSLEVHEGGRVRVCCFTPVVVGYAREQSLTEIWNGAPLQAMRERMLQGDLGPICPSWCPWLLDGVYREIDLSRPSLGPQHHANRELTARELRDGHVVVKSLPLRIRLLPTMRCNIACVMCSQDHISTEYDVPFSHYDLDELMPYLESILVVGGEPLMSRHFRKYVASFDPHAYPDCKLMMITNGLLLDGRFLELMPGRFSWVGVSVDGATKETYERIRSGARWDKLMRNLRALAGHPRRDFKISLLFTIMRSNHHELPAMVELADALGVRLSIHPVHGRAHGEQFETVKDVEEILRTLRHFGAMNRTRPARIQISNLKGTVQFYTDLRTELVGGGARDLRR